MDFGRFLEIRDNASTCRKNPEIFYSLGFHIIWKSYGRLDKPWKDEYFTQRRLGKILITLFPECFNAEKMKETVNT